MNEIHCERCGALVLAEAGKSHYCIFCGLYVCPGCWRSGRCQDCAEVGPKGRINGISIRTARRADRRLREAAIEARAIAGTAGTRTEAWTDYACLSIKVDAAQDSGARALRRLGGGGAGRTLMSERFQRHVRMAGFQLQAAQAAMNGGEADRVSPAPQAELAGRNGIPPEDGSAATKPRAFQWRPVALTIGTGALAVAVLLAPQWLGQSPFGGRGVGEGILGGTQGSDGGAEGSAATFPGTIEASSPPAVASMAPSRTLGFDFDAVRMGGGIGEGWVGSPESDDAVAVAALPTAVDRSAHLMVATPEGTRACRSIDPELADIGRLSVEVLLDPRTPGTATIELRNSAGEAVLAVRFGEARVVLSTGGEPAAEAAGIETGRWYAVEVTATDAASLRVAPLDGASAPVELTVPPIRVESISEVCMGVDGPIDAAASFNNVSITHD